MDKNEVKVDTVTEESTKSEELGNTGYLYYNND